MPSAGRITTHTTGVQIHPCMLDHPGPARQHRAARWRHHGPARPYQHPGQHGHPDAVQHAADIPAAAECVPSSRHATGLHPDRDAADRLVDELPEIHDQPAQGLVWRECDQGERLWLPASPQAHGGPVATADDDGDGGRGGEGAIHPGSEPGGRGGELGPGGARAGKAGVVGGARFRDERDRQFLAEGPAGAARRTDARTDRHGGVLPAVRAGGGEGRHRHQYGSAGAVA